MWGLRVRRTSDSIVPSSEGVREYIRIDRDREHMMRWEAEGVTIRGQSFANGGGVIVEVHVKVEINSPS